MAFLISQRNDAGPQALHFFGYIVYEDGNGTRRSMAFCRRYERTSERFVAVDDPHYEHTA